MKAKLLIPVICAAVILVGAGFIAGRWYVDNRYPAFSGECELYVYPDTGAEVVKRMLEEQCPLKYPGSIDRCFVKERVAENIKPGHYIIEKGKPAIYVARMLNHGWQTPVNLCFSGNTRTKERLAKLISRQMMVDSTSVINALRDNAFLEKFGTDSLRVYEMILPDTYSMTWTDELDAIFARLRREHDAFWTAERQSKAAKIGLTPFQVSVMASIVQGETNYEPEFRRIAGVYMNRLNKGMKLQACPTVCYIFDYKINRVLHKHLAVDSPYNTYKYTGLPPTPINVPGKKYIDAVLDYEKNNFIYFCADPSFNGSHRFAVSYNEHLVNAKAYQRALTASLKARK